VRGLLVGHLEDEFGQVALRHLDPRAFQRVVQADFFAGDALAFHYQLGVVRLADAQHVAAGIGGGGSQIELPAARTHRFLQRVQQVGQAGNGTLLDGPGFILQRVVVGHLGSHAVAVAVEVLRIPPHRHALESQRHADGAHQRALVALVGHRAGRIGGARGCSGRSHHFYSSTRMCRRCGPWTPRTSGPMSAVALGPVTNARFLRSASTPIPLASKSSRGRNTIRSAGSSATCNGISRLAAARSGGPMAMQIEPVRATPANASVTPASAVASWSSVGFGITPGSERAARKTSAGMKSPLAITSVRAPSVARAIAARTSAGVRGMRSTFAAASVARVTKRSISEVCAGAATWVPRVLPVRAGTGRNCAVGPGYPQDCPVIEFETQANGREA